MSEILERRALYRRGASSKAKLVGIQGMMSLESDEHMRWIYDPSHPDYNSERAEWLRQRRAAAIASAPKWMIRDAHFNDVIRIKSIHIPATCIFFEENLT